MKTFIKFTKKILRLKELSSDKIHSEVIELRKAFESEKWKLPYCFWFEEKIVEFEKGV